MHTLERQAHGRKAEAAALRSNSWKLAPAASAPRLLALDAADNGVERSFAQLKRAQSECPDAVLPPAGKQPPFAHRPKSAGARASSMWTVTDLADLVRRDSTAHSTAPGLVKVGSALKGVQFR